MKSTGNAADWDRLIAAARRAPATESTAAPAWFASRVVALAWAKPEEAESLFERFSWRALGVAALIAAGCVVANLGVLQSGLGASPEDELMNSADAVAHLLEVS